MHEKGTTTSYLFLGGSLASALMQVRAALTLAAACTKAVHHLDHLEMCFYQVRRLAWLW
jgi:hypothetical protein